MTDLIEAMNRVNDVLGQLADLAYQKKEFIILGKVKDLDNLIRKEGIIISELERLEDARFRLQGKLAGPAGKAPVSAGEVLELARQSCPHLAAPAQEAVSRLDFNLTRLKMLNDANHELIESSLDHIAFLEAVINGDSAGTYSETGQQPDSRPNRVNILDRKA